MKNATLKFFTAICSLAMALTISCSEESSNSPNEYPSSSSDFTFDSIQYWVGEGENRAMLIIQWNDGKEPAALAWGYKWNGTKYGIDMLMDIAKADEKFFLLVFSDFAFGYALGGIGYDIKGNNSIQLKNETGTPQTPVDGLVETNVYDFDDWTCTDDTAHWKAGWYAGYWSYWVADNISSKWEYSGLGASSRELTNNSVDAWDFDNDMSSFYRCMGNEDCSGRDYFGNITSR
jgi:hypothetical protein